MYNFLENNALYIVLGIVLIIWIGISIYLFVIDRKISKLEKTVIEEKEQ
jgi:CcmD family protein